MANVARKIRLLIADDHRLVLEGLASCLEVSERLEIVATAENGPDVITRAAEHKPDVALIDINMPGMTGLEVTRELVEQQPHVKILIVSMHDNPEYISSALSLGAKGYVLKDVSASEIETAIEAIYSGGTYLSSGASERLVQRDAPSVGCVKLSAREQDVLVRLAEGRSNKEVAAELDISVRTVETHRKNLKRKLAIPTTAGLTRYVIQNGLTRDRL
ncbi:MAG: response regulator transcription factor [Pseudomonadota bacterium]